MNDSSFDALLNQTWNGHLEGYLHHKNDEHVEALILEVQPLLRAASGGASRTKFHLAYKPLQSPRCRHPVPRRSRHCAANSPQPTLGSLSACHLRRALAFVATGTSADYGSCPGTALCTSSGCGPGDQRFESDKRRASLILLGWTNFERP